MARRLARRRLAYLAGFFDGEGSIYPRNGLQVSVAQVDRRPLDLLAPQPSNRRPLFAWTISGKPAGAALRALLPYLIVKRDQAVAAVAYDTLVGVAGNNRVSPEVKAERERLRQIIMQSRTGASSRREDRAWA